MHATEREARLRARKKKAGGQRFSIKSDHELLKIHEL